MTMSLMHQWHDTYKRGLATVEEQLITYRKNEVLFSEEVAVLKREVACKDYEMNVLKSEFEKVKQEKEGIEFKIEKFDKSSKDLDKLLGSQITDKKPEFKNSKENSDDSLVKEQVSKDTSSFVESLLNVDKETVFLADKKKGFVKPKNHEKPVKKSVRPKAVKTARPNTAVVNAVRVNQANAIKASGKLQQDDTGFVDSGCSRHMTGNIAYLFDFKEFDRGYVTCGGGAHGGRISVKGTLKNDSLDFEDHRKLGHINFKKINKLVKDNLVRGLPTKHFENDQTCVACLKGKQHRASCKSKVLNLITKPFFMLHMDLFGLTFMSSLMHRKYCLVVTDDYSSFTCVFFLTTKDETSEILKNYIKEIENLMDKKVKITRSDNGTEFKNKVLDDFCRDKGIRREYSVARTRQQNGVAERRNRTLIEVVRTMLADSKLPTTLWAEAVSTACYVQNWVLVVKPHNKTPYELFRGKFGGKSDEGFFVGYSLSSKAFRVEDGPDNESDEKDKSDDDSSHKEVNSTGQHDNTANPEVNTGRFKLNTVDPSVNTASSYDQHVKRGQDTTIPQSSGPPIKVGDEAVHKELGDSMERAATIASSLEAEQDSDAQTRFETTFKKSNDPPLSRGYTLGSGEDSMKLLELMENCTKLCELNLNSLSIHQMASLEFYDKHNMVAYLEKSEGSEGFNQIIDFLTASHIKNALTECPTLYASPIEQFWQTAALSTYEDEVRGITTTIDRKVKVFVSKASIRRHLKLEDSEGLKTLPTAEIFEQLALVGTVKTSQARRRDKVVISDDEEAKEDPSSQGGSFIEELDLDARISLVPPHAEDQGRFDETQISDQPEEKLGVFSAATALADATRRRRSVENVQTYIRRSGGVSTANRLVSTADISTTIKVDSTAGVKAKDKGKAIMQESKPPKKIKKRVKVQMSIDEELAKALELQRQLDEREEVAAKEAHDIDWSDPSVLRYHALQNRSFSVAEVRKNMCLYLKNQGGYKMSHFKGMSYEDIRPIFERVWDQNQAFIPMGSEIEKEVMKRSGFDLQQESSKPVEEEIVQQDDVVAEQAVKESSRTAGGRRKKSLARKRAKETLSEESAKKQKLEDHTEKEELQVYLNIVPEEESLNIESLATKYPIVDWETQILANDQYYYQIKRADGSVKHYKIFSAMLYDFDRQDVLELYRLVKERFQTASPEGYDLLLWGDLKTLIEPNEEDEIWRNQQDWNLINWKLHNFCGVHVLLMDTGLVIHMMVEKKYPLSQDTLSKMLSRRLEVDYQSEMGYELIRQEKLRGDLKLLISDDEEAEEDPSSQGRIYIKELDLDAGISLVPPLAKDQGRFDETQISDQPEEQLGVFSAATALADAARRRRSVENVQTYIKRRREVTTSSGGVSTASRIRYVR
ncbi:putative ribonuclease H-like domain-containing protein [Tanacetum coccineum]